MDGQKERNSEDNDETIREKRTSELSLWVRVILLVETINNGREREDQIDRMAGLYYDKRRKGLSREEEKYGMDLTLTQD